MKLDALKSFGGQMYRITAKGKMRREGDRVVQTIDFAEQRPCRCCGGEGWVDKHSKPS